MRLYVESYGCALNRGEVESALRSLGGAVTVVDAAEAADLLLLSTCVVIHHTELRMRKRLEVLRGLGKPLIVTGCFVPVFPQETEGGGGIVAVAPGDPGALAESLRKSLTPGTEAEPPSLPRSCAAIVPIATGCSGGCTYCITRRARGTHRSRLVSEISGEVKRLVKEGYREIDLASQDSALYGAEIGASLSDLIAALGAFEGGYMLRIGMMNPGTARPLLPQLLEIFQHPRVFRFLHLPIQSGSDAVLEMMGRGYTIAMAREVAETLRKAHPDLTLSTDVIVGFPGETEEDHRATMDALRALSPDIVNVTRFSPRPGTPAWHLKQLPGWVVKRRSRETTELRNILARRRNESCIGQVVECLVTEQGKIGTMIARTQGYKQVILKGRVTLGAWQRVRVTDATAIDLRGKILPDVERLHERG
ncbi:MAG: tRNA (N(6)-L-threonylcarbamoyladenosine(37)-C(2))-methylthiotransferase [Candidatus Thermoplasmatota archaeon]